jgi:hypothetical protein
MTKQEEFLWMVQTIILARPPVMGLWGLTGDAIAASHRIPSDMSCRNAAHQFCQFFLIDSERDGPALDSCPAWLTNLTEPPRSVYEDRGLLTL